jgi:hypothetical protein
MGAEDNDMDPVQTLIDADQAISDGDNPTALDLLRDYFHWRLRGGFQPTLKDGLSWGGGGDVVADKLMYVIIDHLNADDTQ